jgi:hypothetical protein
MEQSKTSGQGSTSETMRITKGRIFTHRNGQIELDRFQRVKKRRRVRKCSCQYCVRLEFWKDLGNEI